MPEVSRFYGIVIQIFFDDHNPPHFHARYGDAKAMIGIRDLALMEGKLPSRALGFVIEWADLHREELLAAWDRAKRREAPGKITPLD